MIFSPVVPEHTADPAVLEIINHRREARGDQATILAEVYEQDTNIAIWKRQLRRDLITSVEEFLHHNRSFEARLTVTPKNAAANIATSLGSARQTELSEDIAALVGMFCCLFEVKRAGLRMAILDHAMCPKFHVDRVPCRLVTTYLGTATEWLPHHAADRSKLGRGDGGKADADSGLYNDSGDIQRLDCGDVALLKGELWQGNENAGLIHRSPMLADGERRFLVNIDFSM